MNDNVFYAVLTGTAPHTTTVDAAVVARFAVICNEPEFAERDDFCDRTGYGFDYMGNRTAPESLAWRMLQDIVPEGVEATPEAIICGEFDTEIAATFHHAASTEWYYNNEKDWGHDY